MKFLVVGDLHGRKPHIKTRDFDYIIVPGDVCSDKYDRKLWNKYFMHVKESENLSIEPLEFENFINQVLRVKPKELKNNHKKIID